MQVESRHTSPCHTWTASLKLASQATPEWAASLTYAKSPQEQEWSGWQHLLLDPTKGRPLPGPIVPLDWTCVAYNSDGHVSLLAKDQMLVRVSSPVDLTSLSSVISVAVIYPVLLGYSFESFTQNSSFCTGYLIVQIKPSWGFSVWRNLSGIHH